jgi:DNA-binding CsgD family transcriptional regulator
MRRPPPGLRGAWVARPDLVILSEPIAPEVDWPELTPAEARVASLALAGLDNRTIARERGVAPSTISSQLEAIYRKLGVGSRSELAGLASRRSSAS